MQKKSKKGSTKKVLKEMAVAGAITSAAYMLLGPDGKKNQAKIKKVAKEVKGKVLKGVKVAKKEIAKDVKIVKKEVKKAVTKGANQVKKW